MQQPRVSPSLEVLQVNRDDVGPYIRIRAALESEETDIRWGLDEFTYVRLDKLLNALFPGHFPSEHYKCFLSFENQSVSNFAFTGWIVCQLGVQQTKLSFECAELYKSNLEWLKNIESLEELTSLSWEHWIDAYQFEDTHSSYEILEALETIKAVSTRSKIRKMLWLSAILFVVFCALGVFSWLEMSHRYRFALMTTQKTVQSIPKIQTHKVGITNHKSVSANKGASNTKPTVVSPDSAKALVTTSQSDIDTSSASYSCPQVYKVPKGEVALTFDDGPSPYTGQILQDLSENHVNATFFFTGINVKRWPNFVREAAVGGNEVEDHSMNHPDLQDLTTEQQSWEINQTAKEIEQYTNQPVTLFRPPYEAFNNDTKWVLHQNGMALALYNQDPTDWNATSAKEVVQRVLSLPASGSVFILHDRKYTAEALPAIIQAFKAEHLKIVLLPTA